jgi:hypothetical protein
VNPVVEASVIAGTATGTVAIVGYLVNAWTTSRTLRANREIAHDQRLWDKRAAIYEEIAAWAEHLRERRTVTLRRTTERKMPEMFETSDDVLLGSYYEDPSSWFKFSGRIRIFGSEKVNEAFQVAFLTDLTLILNLFPQKTAKMFGLDSNDTNPTDVASPPEVIKKLKDEAFEATTALIEAVRAELLPQSRRHFR